MVRKNTKKGNNNNSGNSSNNKKNIESQNVPQQTYPIWDNKYESYTKEQLKIELKTNRIKSSGTKTQMLQRLKDKLINPSLEINSNQCSSIISNNNNNKNKMASIGYVRADSYTFPSQNGNGDTNTNNIKISNNNNKQINNELKKRTDSKIDSIHFDINHSNKNKNEELLKKERNELVIWKHPIITIHYFLRGTLFLLYIGLQKINNYRISVGLGLILLNLVYLSSFIEGPHQPITLWLQKKSLWCLYWLGLGVLSSVGLGTGFHTFLLYLGPHIASVTLAAYECETLNFPEPPYPDEIMCPTSPSLSDNLWRPSMWNIMSKVSVEAMMWGAGTALGELPPYFISRAARLSVVDPDEADEIKELQELHKKKNNPELMTIVDRLKLKIETLVNKVGFFGILACASIPNPLFDLAGITCGHFLIPFWTFFGATLIGKAIIKMSIQVIFVIIAFNEILINKILDTVKLVPFFGTLLVEPVTNMLINQKNKLHNKTDVSLKSGNILASIIEYTVISMVLFFVVSIINAMAQSHHQRIHSTSKVKK